MGFKRKFQIGDKVRVIDSSYVKYKEIGKIVSYLSNCGCKGLYEVKFEDNTYFSYKYNELELVEANTSCNISSNKLSISDLKPGMKVRIKPDLKEGQSTHIFVTFSMVGLRGTTKTIKNIERDGRIWLTKSDFIWDIDCFSEIVEEPKEEVKNSEKIEFPLKEGQVVTLLDGKKYQVIKNNTNKLTCSFCSLGIAKCGENRCNIAHINGKPSCPLVIPIHHYFKLYEEQKTEDSSFESINLIEKESSIKEIGIITKVNFTLTDFKSEELKHSKFTVL